LGGGVSGAAASGGTLWSSKGAAKRII